MNALREAITIERSNGRGIEPSVSGKARFDVAGQAVRVGDLDQELTDGARPESEKVRYITHEAKLADERWSAGRYGREVRPVP